MVDAAYRNVSNKSESTNPFGPFYSVKASRTELANSGLSSSRLGFRGVEDLGGGLSASFWLESPITNDDGATGLSNFSRRSTVSLAGSFGEIRLGRDKTATVLNEEQFDPFADTGIGGSLIIDANETSVSGTGYGSNSTYKRAGNMVQYFLPRNLGGFYGNVGYSLHELTRTSPDSVAGADKTNTGRHIGGRVGYAAGPLDVAASYAQNDTSFTTGSGAAAVARPGKIKTFNLGATYDFGVAKLFGEYSRSKDQRDPLNPFTLCAGRGPYRLPDRRDRADRPGPDPRFVLAGQVRLQPRAGSRRLERPRPEGQQVRAGLRAQPVEAHRRSTERSRASATRTARGSRSAPARRMSPRSTASRCSPSRRWATSSAFATRSEPGSQSSRVFSKGLQTDPFSPPRAGFFTSLLHSCRQHGARRLCKPRAALALRHVARQVLQLRYEARDVRHADAVREGAKHQLVVGGVAHVGPAVHFVVERAAPQFAHDPARLRACRCRRTSR